MDMIMEQFLEKQILYQKENRPNQIRLKKQKKAEMFGGLGISWYFCTQR